MLAAEPVTGEPGAIVGAIVGALLLTALAVADWPSPWSEPESTRHEQDAVDRAGIGEVAHEGRLMGYVGDEQDVGESRRPAVV